MTIRAPSIRTPTRFPFASRNPRFTAGAGEGVAFRHIYNVQRSRQAGEVLLAPRLSGSVVDQDDLVFGGLNVVLVRNTEGLQGARDLPAHVIRNDDNANVGRRRRRTAAKVRQERSHVDNGAPETPGQAMSANGHFSIRLPRSSKTARNCGVQARHRRQLISKSPRKSNGSDVHWGGKHLRAAFSARSAEIAEVTRRTRVGL